jgi:hypothetical protein
MPKIEIEFTGTECFVVFDGTRIAKRGKNRTWISLKPGFVVSGDDDRLVIDHNGVRVHPRGANRRAIGTGRSDMSVKTDRDRNDRAIHALADDIGDVIADSKLGNGDGLVALMLVWVDRLALIENYAERKAAYDEAQKMLLSGFEIANKAVIESGSSSNTPQ